MGPMTAVPDNAALGMYLVEDVIFYLFDGGHTHIPFSIQVKTSLRFYFCSHRLILLCRVACRVEIQNELMIALSFY